MSRTEDRIREALVARAGTPAMTTMPPRAHRRVRLRQAGLTTVFGCVVATLVAFVVVASGTIGGSAPRPISTFDPAADGYTSPLEDVPPHWPAVDIADPADAYIPTISDPHVIDGPIVLASGTVDGSSFTLYAYTERRDGSNTACLGFVGFAAPGMPTRSAPDLTTCANAPAVPEEHDLAFIGAGSGDGRLEANFGFVSGRADVVYVWGGGTYGMFSIPKLAALEGWKVDPFFFVPAMGAGPVEVDARLRGGLLSLAHANICQPSDVPGGCRTEVVQDFPLTSPVDVPLPLAPGEWPIVTYGGDFAPYVDHQVDADGIRDPGVVGEKQVVAYGTVQAEPWSLVGYNLQYPGAPNGTSPAEDLSVGGGGTTGATLYTQTPWRPNDLSAGRGHTDNNGFDSLDGLVSSRVSSVRLELTDGTVRQVRLFPGPSGVGARYFVIFIPHSSMGRLVALDASGREIEQMCLSDMMGVPPGGDRCA
jgi:hypothetical protein